jgi:hypothetical protein
LAQEPPTKHPATAETSSKSAQKKSPDTFTLVGAGDIAGCSDLSGAQATAKLIDAIPGTVFAAGDLAYDYGTYEEFQKCYDPTWGRFKARTRPTPGNHEYIGSAATGYFRYWDGQAGDPGKGYYSFDLGAWHIVVLNTNCGSKELGGCAKASPEETWLKQDLAAHPAGCTLAYGHHALFSSGLFPKHAEHPELRAFWQDLYEAHADLMLAGHEHSYERFAPQNPEGKPDPEYGVREIVVGTGGRSHTPLGYAKPNSEVRDDKTYGVLKLTLSPGKYRWQFIPVPGKTFHDSGEGICHTSTVPSNQ